MKLFLKSALVIASLVTTLSLATVSTTLHQGSANAAYSSGMPSFATELKSNNDAFYDQAREALPEDFYTLYRIVERLARANGLDGRPWRVQLNREYEVNAYASELNKLTFMAGMLDQLHGDNAALACVVGHEMAHHTREHIPTMVEVEAILQQLLAEAEAEAVAEIQAAQQQQATNTFLGNVLGGIIGGSVGGTTRDILGSLSAADRQQAEARATQIYQQKVAALEAEYSAILQGHEYEADEYGYKYIVRAGFDPQGCLRVMDVLDQNEHSRLPSFSHPRPSDRIQRLDRLNTQATVNALLSEGRASLSRSPEPLKYGVSRDGVSLRIESRYGTSGSGFPE